MADENNTDSQPATSGVTTEENTLLTGNNEQQSGDDNSSGSKNTDGNDSDADNKGGESDKSGADESGKDEDAGVYADFSVPEGMELDGELMTKATEMFKADGLSQEQAQKYIDLYSGQIKAVAESQTETYNQLMEDWQTKAKEDKEFGGDAFDESIGLAKTALDKFGTPELKEFLEAHGAGNHPEVIRFMVKVGRLTKEDNPDNSGDGQSAKKDRVSQLYPND